LEIFTFTLLRWCTEELTGKGGTHREVGSTSVKLFHFQPIFPEPKFGISRIIFYAYTQHLVEIENIPPTFWGNRRCHPHPFEGNRRCHPHPLEGQWR